MFVANLTQEAFDTLNLRGRVVVFFSPPGCSGRDSHTEILEIVSGKIPDYELTQVMVLNGQKMLVFVHHLSDMGQESACCRWRQIVFEKVC